MTALAIVAGALATVAACTGWGRVLARWTGVAVDGGLAPSLGLAVLLAFGGATAALGVATAPVLLVVEGFGLAALALPPRLRLPRLDRAQWAFLAIAAALLMLRLLMMAQYGTMEPCDDFLGYFPLVQQVLLLGDLAAPFSVRRISAYGGQTVLQAFAVPGGDPAAMLVADAGLGPIFLLGQGWSFLRRFGAPRPLPLAFVLLVGLGLVIRVNSASQATSLVCFLTLVRLLSLMLEAERRSVSLCLTLGLVAAAASSLRHFNLVFSGLLMLAFVPAYVARRGWRVALADAAIVAAGWIAALAPWMVALHASSGTPLYPIIKGNHSGFDYAAAPGGWSQVGWALLGMLLVGKLAAVLALVPAAFLVRGDRQVVPVQLAALAGAAAIVVGFPNAEPNAMARYLQPPLLTACFLTVTTALGMKALKTRLLRAGIAVLLFGGLAIVGFRIVGWLIDSPAPSTYPVALFKEREAAYAEAQAFVPAGAPIYAYVSTPFSFDVTRNRILNADVPGAVSPPPGQPFFAGSEAVAAYLLDLGIRYAVFEDYDTAVTWCITPRAAEICPVPMSLAWHPYLMDLSGNLRALARSRRVLYDAHGVTLIDLAAVRP